MHRLAITLAVVLAFLTLAITNAADRAEAPLDRLAWLAGDWRIEDEDSRSQEVWTEPHGNNITGVFRLFDAQGNLRVLELLTISHEDDRYVLRFRHFDDELTPWASEADGPITLHATEAGDRSITFHADEGSVRAMRFERTQDSLKVSITPPGDQPSFSFEFDPAD